MRVKKYIVPKTKAPDMRSARRISQIIFLLLFIYLFFQATYPFDSFLPPDLFLRLSPLAALSTILSTRHFITLLIPALILLLITIFSGRFFCGWICPLGTIIDGSDRYLKPAKRKRENTVHFRRIKFIILLIILFAALFSTQLIGYFDPIVLLTRTLTTTIFPVFTFLLDGLLQAAMKIAWLEEPVYELYDFLQGQFLPILPHFFRNSVLYFLILIGILSLGLFSPRFWCRNLCPLGALLGIFSKYRLLQRVVDVSCTKGGKCQRECKMNAIEDDYTSNNPVECIECMNCVATCPPHSIHYQFRWRRSSAKIDLTKRQFVQSLASGVLTVGLLKTGFLSRNQKGEAIRPPGALEEAEFLDHCLRCHECTRICSTTGGCLQPAGLESGPEGIWTPISVSRTGYCEYNCNLCGQVCPTGAIRKLSVSEKQQMKMGTASFDKNRCIPWYRFENCLVCEEHCPVADKAIKFEEKEITRPTGEKVMVKFPYVREEKCVGCGICVTKCPLAGKAGIFVSNQGEIRSI
jgi:polyferredoxin